MNGVVYIIERYDNRAGAFVAYRLSSHEALRKDLMRYRTAEPEYTYRAAVYSRDYVVEDIL
jgi:hypothetical protein